MRSNNKVLGWMNKRLDAIMEEAVKNLPDYMEDVIKYGFINDNNQLMKNERKMQTKINLHYFKKKYAKKVVEVLSNYFKTKYFGVRDKKNFWTGWILIVGSVGNHGNWEPRLLNSMKKACEEEGLNFNVVGKTEKNQYFGSSLLVQFLKKGYKKWDGNEGQPWYSYYTDE